MQKENLGGERELKGGGRGTEVEKENFKVEGGEERMGECWKRISAQLFYQVGDHHQHQRHLPSASSSSSS